jgi:hypothetical protein
MQFTDYSRVNPLKERIKLTEKNTTKSAKNTFCRKKRSKKNMKNKELAQIIQSQLKEISLDKIEKVLEIRDY